LGTYYVQAVWDQNEGESIASSPGNIYSDVVELKADGQTNQVVSLTLTTLIEDRSVIDHPLVKEFMLESALLSDFWNKPMKVKPLFCFLRDMKIIPIKITLFATM